MQFKFIAVVLGTITAASLAIPMQARAAEFYSINFCDRYLEKNFLVY
jgi:hypothetical protein